MHQVRHKKSLKWLVSKETLCCVGGQVKQLFDYQLEVDKGKLTAVANKKSLASESKPLQNRSRVEIPDQARQEERLSRSQLKESFLISSDAFHVLNSRY